MDLPQAVQNSIDPIEKIDSTRTIYNAGAGEIFFKNFLAGFGRAIGGLFIYLIFLGVIGYISFVTIYPRFAPLLGQYMTTMQSLQNLGGTPGKTTVPVGSQYQQLINQFQQVNK